MRPKQANDSVAILSELREIDRSFTKSTSVLSTSRDLLKKVSDALRTETDDAIRDELCNWIPRLAENKLTGRKSHTPLNFRLLVGAVIMIGVISILILYTVSGSRATSVQNDGIEVQNGEIGDLGENVPSSSFVNSCSNTSYPCRSDACILVENMESIFSPPYRAVFPNQGIAQLSNRKIPPPAGLSALKMMEVIEKGGTPLTKYAVNIGTHDGVSLDPIAVLFKNGWKGMGVDNQEVHRSTFSANFPQIKWIKHWVKPGSFEPIMKENDVPIDLDVLKIDIDSYDIFVAESILKAGYKPKLVFIEVNELIPPPIRFALLPGYECPSGCIVGEHPIFGASLSAACDIMEDNGYDLLEHVGGGAVYIQRELTSLFGDIPHDAATWFRAGYADNWGSRNDPIWGGTNDREPYNMWLRSGNIDYDWLIDDIRRHMLVGCHKASCFHSCTGASFSLSCGSFADVSKRNSINRQNNMECLKCDF